MIRSSMDLSGLCRLVSNQCNKQWPDDYPVEAEGVCSSALVALERLEYCFSKINNKYFFDGKSVVFDHLHGDQYAMWLYMLSNQLFRDSAPEAWCKKIFLLNKALHGCDIFYEVALPSVFLLVHPLGTVLGRGQYSDFFVAYQRCGVGSNHGVYPSMEEHVTLRPGSAVLGNSHVGKNVTIAADSLVIDLDISTNTTYFGSPRDHWTRPRTSLESIWRL